MTTESTFVLLFTIATAVAIAVRRLAIPYTVALVVVGLGLGALHVVEAPHLTKELLFAVILPGLIFEAAFNLDVGEFWRNRLSIGALAVPGVVVAIALTAVVVTSVMSGLELDVGFDWRHGLVFGALIAATDPIAVVALFKRLNVPHRLGTLVEGESLLNDGTSVVVFGLIVAFVTGAVSTPAQLVLQFFTVVGGGAIAGAIVGVAATQVTKRIDEPMIEVTLTVIAAYGSFVLAEEFHCSGVIATVVAGMLCGGYGRRYGMSPTTRLAVETFWDYAAFALNSIVFLLMGFEVQFGALAAAWGQIAVAYIAALVGRFGVVAAVVALLRPTGERLPVKWTAVLTWGGLRGALSMVLALALPEGFPHRDQLITLTFGVVLLSLLVQGLTMSWLLQRLGIVHAADRGADLDRARGHLHASDAALEELKQMERTRAAPGEVIQDLRRRYEARRETAERELAALHVAQADLRTESVVRAVRHLLALERTRIADAASDGLLRGEVARELTADVDQRMARLDAGNVADPADLVVPPMPQKTPTD